LSASAIVSTEAISRLVTVDDEIDFGAVIRKLWPEDMPSDEYQPTAAHVYQRSKTVRRTVTTITRVAGHTPPPAVSGGGRGGGQFGGGVFGVADGPLLNFPGSGVFGVADGPLLEFGGSGGGSGPSGGGAGAPTTTSQGASPGAVLSVPISKT